MDEFRTTRQLRRDALAQDALLFCLAFTAGALVYVTARGIHALITDSTSDFWSIGVPSGACCSFVISDSSVVALACNAVSSSLVF